MGKITKILINIAAGATLGALAMKLGMKYFGNKRPNQETNISAYRFEIGFHLFNNWMKLKNDGKTLEAYFKDNEISTVAIYGMGALGERLYEDLKACNINVMYAIDRIAGSKNIEGLKIIGAEDELKQVDAIIVTPVQDFYAIEEALEQKTDADIISLEDIVEYCL